MGKSFYQLWESSEPKVRLIGGLFKEDDLLWYIETTHPHTLTVFSHLYGSKQFFCREPATNRIAYTSLNERGLPGSFVVYYTNNPSDEDATINSQDKSKIETILKSVHPLTSSYCTSKIKPILSAEYHPEVLKFADEVTNAREVAMIADMLETEYPSEPPLPLLVEMLRNPKKEASNLIPKAWGIHQKILSPQELAIYTLQSIAAHHKLK